MSILRSLTYLGNPRLKRAGVKTKMTQEQILEFKRCRHDIVYFIEKYMKIRHVDRGLIPFELYDYQKELLLHLKDNRYTITTTCRQAGKSTTTVAFFLHYIIFNSYKEVGILANKGATAKEILGRLKLAYEELPQWMQQGVETWNKGNIELENGCSVLAASTSSSAVRGYSFSTVFVDEAAFVPTNVWDEFYKSTYPTISSGSDTKFMLVSTPNGMNHYYQMWENANKEAGEDGKSLYAPFTVTWKSVPGRDEKWKEETIANQGLESFLQEHECQFLGISNTLIPTSKLKTLVSHTPILHKPDEGFSMYEKPERGHTYVLSADTSSGKGLDYSAFHVIDVTEYPYKQVAVYRNNQVSTLLYPSIIQKVAMDYNEAWVLIETNNMGMEVAHTLQQDLEYENMLYLAPSKKHKKEELGILTTKATKALGCSNLDDLVRNDKLILNDADTILELSGFIRKGKSYEADVGFTDDLVMGLVIFSWLTTHPYFKDLTDQDLRSNLFSNRVQQLEEDLVPIGFIDDGLDEFRTDPDEPKYDASLLW